MSERWPRPRRRSFLAAARAPGWAQGSYFWRCRGSGCPACPATTCWESSTAARRPSPSKPSDQVRRDAPPGGFPRPAAACGASPPSPPLPSPPPRASRFPAFPLRAQLRGEIEAVRPVVEEDTKLCRGCGLFAHLPWEEGVGFAPVCQPVILAT